MFENYFNKKRQLRGAEIDEITENSSDLDETRVVGSAVSGNRLKIFRVIVFVIFLLLGARVFYLQIARGGYYSELSRENRVRSIVIKAPRGIIYDRNGEKLVNNVPSFDLIAIPVDIPKDQNLKKQEMADIAEMFGMNSQNIEVIVGSQNESSMNPVLIKENVSQDESLIFTEKYLNLKGFALDQTAVRQYEDGPYFSSFIGYSGKISKDDLAAHPDYLMTDYIGKTGVEYSYEKNLRGVNGKQEVEVDSAGNIQKDFGVTEPVPGSDLVLGIDADLQKKLEDSLQAKLNETGTKTAAAVAIDPRNGEILAMVNLPSYDNNLFAKGISADDYQKLMSDPDKPMFNRSISGEYPPGSTFKPLVAAAALQEGTITPSTTLDCPAAINIGSYSFPDWKTHGLTDVRKAIAESVDIFFYAVGGGWGDITGLGIDKIQQYADKFGLGRKLGIDIPGEVSGLIPTEQWKQDKLGERWYLGDDYHCAIGQGFVTVTPLQLANYIAAIANGGTVFQPHLVDSIKKIDGSVEKLNKNFVSAANLQVVREGMRQTVLSGTAQPLKDLPVEVAGKTGTAQFGSGNEREHGWFVSFAPYNNPTIAMAVLVEGGGEGFSTAEPVTHDVYQWYFGDRNKQ
ncbi:MAG: penicillin-binding protein 2 [Candidatus Moranbacteria bacterium]|nr:penicillin-binding protein 2 [Candidatus Moranbacteria bacterium]